MTSTVFTYLTTLLVVLLVVGVLNFWMGRSRHVMSYPPKVLLLILLIPFIRLLVPIEFPFTYVIESDVVYHAMTQLFIEERLQIKGVSVSIWNSALLIWALGFVIRLSAIIRHYFMIADCFKYIPATKEEYILNVFHSELARYAKAGAKEKQFRIVQTRLVVEPMIYGIRRPTILIPLQSFSDDELRFIIGHELGHYFHGDLVWKWILEVVCAFHWWLPLISKLKQTIYHVMEINADYVWLKGKSHQDQIEYMETLLKICKKKEASPHKQPVVMALYSYGDPLSLEKRFHSIQNMIYDNVKRKRASILLLVVLCLISIMSLFIVILPLGTGDNSIGIDLDSGNYYLKPHEDGGYGFYNESGYLGYVSNVDEGLGHLPIIE